MPRPQQWPEEISSKLRLLWSSHSGSEISDMLGAEFNVCLTRNAIIGRAARMGLPCKGPMARKPVTPRVAKPRPPKPKAEPRKAPLPFKPRVVRAAPLLIPFGDLTDGACKYECTSNDHPADYRFCGLPQSRGSYCFHHAELCLVEPNSHRRAFVPVRAA